MAPRTHGLRPHVPWLQEHMASSVGRRALLFRLLSACGVRVTDGLLKRWLRAERASQEVLPPCVPGGAAPSRQRKLHDLDDLDVYGEELRALLSKWRGSYVYNAARRRAARVVDRVRRVFVRRHPDIECELTLWRRWLLAEGDAPGDQHWDRARQIR